MKILLTGGSGFIGKNLLENLRTQYTVFAPTHKQLDLTNCQDVGVFIKTNKIDVIIHTAVGSGATVLPDTLRMFFAVLKNADKVKKIIHFGSGAEYAKNRDLMKVKESDFGKYIPRDDYGFAKYVCSQVSERYKNVITLRLFGIYGKYEGYLMKFISNSIAKNLIGIPITIKQDVVFDYLYIDDLIPIITYVLSHHMKHRYYNVTPTKSTSLSKVAHIINRISHRKSEVKKVHKGFNFRYTGDNRLLLNEIRELKFQSYSSGINNLFDYYRDNITMLDKKKIKEDKFFRAKDIRSI